MSNLKLRPRRLRRSENIRAMVRETSLSVKDFVYPIFVVPGDNIKEEIPSMPGCYHLSVDRAVETAKEIAWRSSACRSTRTRSVRRRGT